MPGTVMRTEKTLSYLKNGHGVRHRKNPFSREDGFLFAWQPDHLQHQFDRL